jgi:hypothetical protein
MGIFSPASSEILHKAWDVNDAHSQPYLVEGLGVGYCSPLKWMEGQEKCLL